MQLKKNTDNKDGDGQSVSIYDVFRQHYPNGCHPINLTVGNPNVPPPQLYYDALRDVLNEISGNKWNGHGYMVDEDPFGLCQKIAMGLSRQFKLPFERSDIHITVGATGALDVICKTLLDHRGPCRENPYDSEVIILAPYFVEYVNFVKSNGGVPITVHANADFGPDVPAIEKAITCRTKLILINSPNNPTGAVYSFDELKWLAAVVAQKEQEFGTKIYIVEDAVYNSITFNECDAPSMAPLHPHLFRVNSWSKSLSLSGERIGYFAMHPEMGTAEEKRALRDALFLNMRMRVVHAPLLQHRVLARLPLDLVSDTACYRQNIHTLFECISQLGFHVKKPQGTFYLWAKLPEQFEDEQAFRNVAMQGNEPLLYLPGALFGGKKYCRYIRFSACVAFEEIQRACVRLQRVVAESSGAAKAACL